MDSDKDTYTTRRSSEILDERPQSDMSLITPALIHGVMDDEGPDDVFIPPLPPPTCEAHLLPTEGSRDRLASNSGLTFSNGAADASSTKANPNSLDMHHGEKHLMTVQDKMDEVIQSTIPSSKESVEDTLPSNDENFTPRAHQDQTYMDGTACPEESCQEKAGSYDQDNVSGDEESNDEQEDLCKEEENFMKNNANSFPQLISPKKDENSENESCPGKDGDQTETEDVCCLYERDCKLSRYNVDNERVETNVPALSGLTAYDDNSKSSEKPEFGKFNQNMIGESISQCQVTSTNEGHVGRRSSDYSLTKSDCSKKESGTTETQTTRFTICKGLEEMAQQIDGSWRIATDIQQGEQLLERLQMVQLRHDEIPEAPQEINKARDEEQVGLKTDAEAERMRGKSVTSEEEEEGSELNIVKKEEAKANLAENNNNEEEVETKTAFMSTMPEQSEQDWINTKEKGFSLNNQDESLGSPDLSLDCLSEMSCTEIASISTVHRFSAAETSKEKQLHEAAQGKQNLQRAEGLFNLADNPDVLEIPFKTNLSLESLVTRVCTSQPSHLQLSETKMHQELSPEIQRRLVMVNQGKKPGGCSQLKETKLLFEAFQQDNTKGPTRHWKPTSSVIKGDVYPSVLERTRSLEMFSLKTCPVTRVHSLRLYNSATTDREKSPESLRSKSPENLRTKSPTGGREKSRLSPYSKHDKYLRLHRSMDSISSEASTSVLKTKDKSTEGDVKQDSPILKQNPFFKLRPALALQPEVQKDIQEAKEREEELRRQRCKLYGEFRQKSEDQENSRCTQTLRSDDRKQSRGKLEHVWPPPSKKDQKKSEQTQQEVKVHTAGGQRALLWQRWESGLINEPALDGKK